MTRSKWRQPLTAVILSLGMVTGLARAQQPPAVVSTPPTEGEVVEVGEGMGAPVEVSTGKGGWIWQRPLFPRIAQHRPFCCYGNINDFSCGSFNSECVFLFGGCRGFFGETCVKGAPAMPPPYPDKGRPSAYQVSDHNLLIKKRRGFFGNTAPGAPPGPGGTPVGPGYGASFNGTVYTGSGCGCR